MKHFLESRTIRMAIVQAVAGVVIGVATEFGEVGIVMVMKSILDAYLRWDTDTKITA